MNSGSDIEPEICVKCLISGLVQGVWYRASAQAEAEQLKLRGYARNLEDGRVEVIACGSPAAVQGLIDWLHRGPPNARVSDVSTEPLAIEQGGRYTAFEIG
jgi:acylphosphatase